MKRYRKLLFFTLASLVIFACNLPGVVVQNLNEATPTDALENIPPATLAPTLTADPSIAAKACLVGNWEIGDLSPYILAAIPPDMAEQYKLQYKGASGKAYFTLSPNGELDIQADQLEMLFEAQASIFTVPISVRVDGEASGTYSVDENRLTTSNVDTSRLTASAQAMGNDLLDSGQILNAIPLLRPPYNSAEFTCAGDRLQLKVSSYTEQIPPLDFNRLK